MGRIANLLKKLNLLKKAENDWVTVLQSTDEYTVRIQKLKLEDHEVPVTIFDQRDSSYNAFGYIYLNVPKEYEERALEIINTDHE